ncbi:MAG: 4Fe-4S ferredoxin [Desulfobacteraceae bacterium]|nr:4Fe-4S ferredoxin [Desulfobacteraceae bacterium]
MTAKSPYQQFAANMFQEDSIWLPRILESMINEEQAELLISLPGSQHSLAAKLKRSEEEIESDLADLFHKGLAFKKMKDGVESFRAPAHIAQFHDASIVWPEAPKAFYDLWKQYMEEEWPKLAPLIQQFMPKPFTRVIPVNKSIDAGKVKVLTTEDVKQTIENAGRLAVTKCTCRLTMGKCDAPLEVCLQVNRGAEYTIERGSGREVTKAEALGIIESAQEAGLVHVTMNKADIGGFICNCCGCCCQSFSLLVAEGVSLCDPSRYAPAIDAGKCSSCGLCEERCWFEAVAVNSYGIAEVNRQKCLGCGQCATVCPEEAISMTEVREPDFIPGYSAG